MAVQQWVKDIVAEVVDEKPLEVGKRYLHPEHGVITITSGQYWGSHGLSNHWHWVDEQGVQHAGYGGRSDDGTWSVWPEVAS
jgi:hypothetical protein